MIPKGTKFKTNCGFCKVIKYYDANKVAVKFIKTKTMVITTINNLRKGTVHDPMFPALLGKGYIGIGKYSSTTDRKLYAIWAALIRRCTDAEFKNSNSAYADATLCNEWLNFQKFCKDITAMDNWNTKDFELDKDLRHKRNKHYSPDTCSFVPKIINNVLRDDRRHKGSLPIGLNKRPGTEGYNARVIKNGKTHFLGTYPTIEEAAHARNCAKISYIKSLAKTYKNVIHPEVYKTLKGVKIKDLYLRGGD